MAHAIYAKAINALRARLGEDAVEHSLRVAATAAELARTYGVDSELAELAGLLHDWDREQSPEALVSAAREAGLAPTSADQAVPYLLHARTGAVALAQVMPELPAEVATAVARHTMGAVDMSPLDMVVYLADMIEPARAYPGVDTLRAAVGTMELTELFALGYEHALAHLVSSRRPIHPETVAVWNALVVGGQR